MQFLFSLWHRVESSINKVNFREISSKDKSFIKIWNKVSPSTDPWGSPQFMSSASDVVNISFSVGTLRFLPIYTVYYTNT